MFVYHAKSNKKLSIDQPTFFEIFNILKINPLSGKYNAIEIHEKLLQLNRIVLKHKNVGPKEKEAKKLWNQTIGKIVLVAADAVDRNIEFFSITT